MLWFILKWSLVRYTFPIFGQRGHKILDKPLKFLIRFVLDFLIPLPITPMCQTSTFSATPGTLCGCDDQPYHVLFMAASYPQYAGELTIGIWGDEPSLVIILLFSHSDSFSSILILGVTGNLY